MAYEVKVWKKPGCSLTLMVNSLSDRETFSKEINETYGEGGGLNADYRTVEAVAVAANILGQNGLKYGVDFIFKTGGLGQISLDFADEVAKEKAELILMNAIRPE